MLFQRKKLTTAKGRLRRVAKIFAGAGEIIIVANFLFFIASWISRTPLVKLTDIHITASATIDANTVRSIVDEELGRSIFWRIRRDNAFAYPREVIRSRIGAIDPRIAAVSVSADFPHRLTIGITEYSPALLWCAGDEEIPAADLPADTERVIATTTLKKCYYANSSGFIYAESPEFFGALFPIYRTKISATSSPTGQRVLSAATYAKIENFLARIRERGIAVRAVSEEENGDFVFTVDRPWRVLWSIEEDPAKSAENLILAIRAIEKKTPMPPVTVIDLRFGNKVFYK